jgi:hypothetical protein
MGEILFRTRLSEDMFKGLAPWMQRLPGRLLPHQRRRLRDLRRRLGFERGDLRDDRQDEPARARASAAIPDMMSLGSLAGAGTLGLLIPPSIIMIVYGVTADVSISQLFIGGVIPGIVLAGIFSLYIAGWSIKNAHLIRRRRADELRREAARIEEPDPRRAAHRRRARLDLRRHRHRDRGGRGSASSARSSSRRRRDR